MYLSAPDPLPRRLCPCNLACEGLRHHPVKGHMAGSDNGWPGGGTLQVYAVHFGVGTSPGVYSGAQLWRLGWQWAGRKCSVQGRFFGGQRSFVLWQTCSLSFGSTNRLVVS